MTAPAATRYEARGACPSCGHRAFLLLEIDHVIIGGRLSGIEGRVVEVRHSTPTGSNNCGGIL